MEFSYKTREIIVPSPPSPPHVVTLSNNDQIMPPYYTTFLYFFPPPSSPPQTLSLKHSFARALAAFPPVAGRLKLRSNGAGMDVECNNQGAVFVEAHVTATLQHMLTTGNGDVRGGGMYQPTPLWKLLAPNPYEEPTDKPLLLTQLTRLGCGGVVVAVLLNHLVADGAAQAHFVSSWADLARGEAITAHPHLDRACMKARSPPCPSFEHKEYIIHKHVPSFSGAATELPPTTFRIFEFLPEDILVLKQRANAEVGKDAFTGFQALAAHIWKHVTKARGIEASQAIKLGWAVDGRKRFNPPLPQNYFGNVNFYGCTEASAGEVMAEALQHGAGRIREATELVGDEYMRSALDVIEAQASPALVSGSFVGPADMAITSWVHFAAYDVDWGWGPPCLFAPPLFDVARLAVLLPHPRAPRPAVAALLALDLPHMHALLSDAHFSPVL